MSVFTALCTLASLGIGLGIGYALAHFRAAARLERARSDQIRLQTQLETLDGAREEMANQFQLLASRILDNHSRTFAAQNREAIHALLTPLGEKITDFRQKVEQVQIEDAKQRSALKQEVQTLAAQSQMVGLKADNLAEALKGDNKQLGNWGELSLGRLLDAAGLQKGRDYETQVNVPGDAGARAQPDAVVYLPDNRCVIIDSKMSLKDYMDYTHATDETARAGALKAHVSSMETHVKGLAARRYPDLDAFKDKTPDFVLMFVPNEPALALALSAKPALAESSVRANVILAGPGGLLAALRLIAQIWRQENQRTAMNDVFESLRRIYEKYVGFSEDMKQIDLALQKAQGAYHDAYKKLATGDGNLVRQMDRFVKENIIKPKRLPPPEFRIEEPPAE